MRLARWFLVGIVALMMMGCSADSAEIAATPLPQPTETQLPPTDIPPTSVPPTAAPTLAPPSTATPIPIEPTVAPTATANPTETAIPPTAEPTPEPLEEGACPSLESVANATSPFRVVDGPWPRPQSVDYEVFNAAAGPKLIHLGFDVEGPPEELGEILDVLDRRGVKTTMFIVGSWAENFPDWIRELDARGHEFANHTYTHGNMREMSAEQVADELTRTEAVVQRLTGQTTKPWLRPPFGSRSDISLETAQANGWTTVIWSGSPDDWRPEFDATDMCETLLATSYPGGILYAHTFRRDMAETLDRYIGTMQQQGYTFVPLSVLMSGNPSAYLVEN